MSEAAPAAVVAVMSTAPDAATAERIGTVLVEERLAACANVVEGVTSVFRWKGELEREDEVLVILKTTTEAVDRLRERLVELHPYEVPEVLAFPVSSGHAPYVEWVRREVSGG